MRLLLSILRHARAAFAGRMLWRLAVVIGAATLTGAIAGLLPAVIGRAVSAVAGTDSGAPPAGLSRYIALLMPSGATWSVVVWALAATIITVAIGVLSSKLATSLSGDVTAALRIELMKAVLAASPRDVAEAGKDLAGPARPPGMPPGKTPPPGKPPAATREGAAQAAVVRLAVTRESGLVADFAVAVLTAWPQSLATLGVLAVQLVSADAWVVLIGGIGLFVVSRVAADRASRRVADARRALQNADAAVFGSLDETLTSSEDLRLWGAQRQAVAEFAEVARACAAARERFAAALAVSGQIKSVFTAMAPLLIVVALKLSGRVYDAGAVAELLLLVPLLMVRMEALDGIRQGMIERAPVLDAAHKLLTLPPSPAPAVDPVRLDVSAVAGHLVFDEVSFVPPGAARPVVDAVDLDIPAGSIVGICGPSGSGKSSLVRLLLRLDEPTRGSIRLDGTPIDRIDPEQLPQIFGVVRQTAQLLERPVRHNLGLGLAPPPDDAAMKRALQAVALDELTGQGERDLDTAYRKNPPNFSGGEHRRLLMARMLVQDPPIGVLDEPEAGLPSATAEEILRAVVAEARGRTFVVVTHAPHLLASDFNIVLDRGKVVARGSHDELAAGCEIYRSLLAEALKERRPA